VQGKENVGMQSFEFEAKETQVLDWLLALPTIANAVDLAPDGKNVEASAAVAQVVQDLLRGPDSFQATHPESTTPSKADDDSRPLGAKLIQPLPNEARRQSEPCESWLAPSMAMLEIEAEQQRLRERLGMEQAEGHVEQEPVPLYWKIDLPEVAKVLTQRGILPGHFCAVEHPHTTLLYIGGTDDSRAAELSGLPLDRFRAMRSELEVQRGEELEVFITEIVIEENVACAKILLPASVPCVNTVPHVTLGTKRGVPARYANEVLEEVQAGRTEGVTSIKLPTPKKLTGTIALESSCVLTSA